MVDLGALKHIRADLVQDGAALQITLDSPKGNILSTAMMGEIGRALSAYEDHAKLRLVLLRAEGKHFSFGASVEEHKRELAPTMLASFHSFIRKLAAYPVPVASLVRGSYLGGAFEMVLATHVVFAERTADFGCPEIQLGVFPPVLAAIGSHRLGGALAERLLLTGSMLDAVQAERIGFVTRTFADGDGDAGVWAWFAEEMAPRSAFALRQATRAARTASGLLESLDGALARLERQYIDEVLPSHDGNEGIEAFVARRKPTWEHR